MRQQLERRKIELGVGKHIDIPIVVDEGVVDKDKKKMKEILPDIQLVDFTSEEEREYEAIVAFVRKYRKLLRYLFAKYSNTCYSKKVIEFDALKQKAQVINLGEVTKMFKEHQVNSSMLSRDELITMMRLVSVKSSSSDVSSLTFEGFQDFFLQSAIYIYSKPPALSHLPLVESVKALVEHFKKAAATRGENTVLYTDPETTVLGDQELLKELNRIVKSNPDYPLPEGYRKVTDKQPTFQFIISPSLEGVIGEGRKVATEILDGIVSEAIAGLHIMESIVKHEARTKVCPDIVRPLKQNLPSRYMDLLEKKVKPRSLEAAGTVPLMKKLAIEPERKLPPSMKLVILSMPRDLRPIAKEAAIVLDDIIEAVVEGRKSLGRKCTNANKALRERESYNKALKRLEMEKEQRRRNRHHMLRTKIDGIKRREAEDAENNRERNEEHMRREKERVEKEKMDKIKEREETKRRIQEAKERKEEEKRKQQEDEFRKQKEEEEKKIRLREEFLRRKKEEMVMQRNKK